MLAGVFMGAISARLIAGRHHMRRFAMIASLVGAVALLGVAAYTEVQASPGRCQLLPSGMNLDQYGQKLASENPGKHVWLQKVQATKFGWERHTGSVPCGDNQYAAVFFKESVAQ